MEFGTTIENTHIFKALKKKKLLLKISVFNGIATINFQK